MEIEGAVHSLDKNCHVFLQIIGIKSFVKKREIAVGNWKETFLRLFAVKSGAGDVGNGLLLSGDAGGGWIFVGKAGPQEG